MYYDYVLYCHNKKKLYYGFTSDLKRRMKEHGKDSGTKSTYGEKVELIYYEAYRNEKDARDREKFYKSGWGRNHIKKILKNYLKNIK
jgi:putative endonuclease